MRTFSLCILIFMCQAIQAQLLPWERYTSKNGLLSDRVTAITQDEKGFMWFGTYFGICRYDGIRFQKIDLPFSQQNKYVNFLLGANGRMYAGFMFGGGLAEYYNGKTRSYFIRGKDSLSENEFTAISDNGDGSILLVNSSGAVYQFRQGEFTQLFRIRADISAFPRHILRDKKGTIWIGTGNGLVVSPPPYRSEKIFYRKENIHVLQLDRTGLIWLGRTSGSRTTYQKIAGLAEDGSLSETTVINSNQVLSTPFSSQDFKSLWAVHVTGIMNIRPGEHPRSFDVPIDYTTDINAIFEDRESNIWIANEPGVLKISNFNIEVFHFEEIAAGGGSIWPGRDSFSWASNSKALYCIENNEMQRLVLPLQKPDYIGQLFVDRKKNLWISLWNGGLLCTKWDGKKLLDKKIFSAWKGKTVAAKNIVEDSEGNIWVTGAQGIFRIRDQKIIDSYHPPDIQGNPAFISCMALDEKTKTLWLGDNALGLIKVKYEEDQNGKYTYSVASYIGTADGLKDSYTRSMVLDHQNRIWVGTRYGGIYTVTETPQRFIVRHCNEDARLSCTRIASISRQDTTALLFAACDGVYTYEFSSGSWTHLNTSDGLLNAEVFDVSVDARSGLIWILTAEGITRLDRREVAKPVYPLVNITSVNVLGRPDSTAFFTDGKARYSYSQNSIGFSFAGASFLDEKSITYKYILEGFDKEWSQPVVVNNVNYASLPPGDYVFRVLAANAKGQWSIQPAEFSFRIVIPFYKRTWFIFLLITLMIFIIYLIRIQRLKQHYRIEKIRLTIARDLHDDIGSTLGSINLLSKTAARKMEKQVITEEIKPIFQKIGQSAENTLEAMDDIVWAINPSKDKMEDLVIRMREFAIPLFELKNIKFTFQADGHMDRVVPMNLRRNAFLIFKESVHNILKHSGASAVSIRIQLLHHHFTIMIRDDGKGFHPGLPSQRNGLKNMESRAKMVSGKLLITSSTEGTSIHFTAEIK